MLNALVTDNSNCPTIYHFDERIPDNEHPRWQPAWEKVRVVQSYEPDDLHRENTCCPCVDRKDIHRWPIQRPCTQPTKYQPYGNTQDWVSLLEHDIVAFECYRRNDSPILTTKLVYKNATTILNILPHSMHCQDLQSSPEHHKDHDMGRVGSVTWPAATARALSRVYQPHRVDRICLRNKPSLASHRRCDWSLAMLCHPHSHHLQRRLSFYGYTNTFCVLSSCDGLGFCAFALVLI